jgi:hypothetical protein
VLFETYNEVRIGKYLSHNFSIQNCLKQRDVLLPLLPKLALQYDLRKVQKNQVGLKLNGTNQLLAYAEDVKLLGDNIDTTRKNTGTLIVASMEVDQEVKADQTKYMLLSRHQNAGQNHYITTANRCSENMAQFRYLGTTITNQNLIQEEIKWTLNSGNACYHSVQNLSSSHLLSENIKVRIHNVTPLLPMPPILCCNPTAVTILLCRTGWGLIISRFSVACPYFTPGHCFPISRR